MTDFIRPADENFAGIRNFGYAPNYHGWQDLRIHYVDEGPKDGPVALLTHGMPTWSYLYRDMIPPLVDAGFRCIAPDHAGFGKSDKPTDNHWYTIARHTEILTSLVRALDLQNITLFCQDWGGPTGLAQAALMPERFSRLVIMNTWLHHPEYEYTPGILNWIQLWLAGGVFDREKPEVALIPLLTRGAITPDVLFPAVTEGKLPELSGDAAADFEAYSAPYRGQGDEGYNSFRRFPLSIPVHDYDNGNGAGQTLHYRTLLASGLPTNFFWGCADGVFVEAWGRKWAEQMNATFDAIPDANHFLQETHGAQIVAGALEYIAKG